MLFSIAVAAVALLAGGIASTAAFVATATAITLALDAVRMPVYFATAWHEIVRAAAAIVAEVAGVVVGTLAGERVLRRTVSPVLLAAGRGPAPVEACSPRFCPPGFWPPRSKVLSIGINLGDRRIRGGNDILK